MLPLKHFLSCYSGIRNCRKRIPRPGPPCAAGCQIGPAGTTRGLVANTCRSVADERPRWEIVHKGTHTLTCTHARRYAFPFQLKMADVLHASCRFDRGFRVVWTKLPLPFPECWTPHSWAPKDRPEPLYLPRSYALLIIGSAEALPILCVSDFCERERERERRLWRHWYHAEIASDHAYDYLDGASTQRVDAFWACRAVELRSACKDKELGAWALDWAAGSSDWWTTIGKWKLCVRWSDCRLLPWITQQHFVGMLQARRIGQVDVYFLFEWPWFYLWEQLG